MSTSLHRPEVARKPGFLGRPAPALLVCVIVAVGVFEALWFGVVTDSGLALVDPNVVTWAVAHRGTALVTAAQVVTDTGSPTVTITLTVLLVLRWAWQRDRRRAALGVVGLAGLVVVDVVSKSLVARPRPPLQFHAVVAQGWSFPSGHAMLSAGTVLLVAWLVRERLVPTMSAVVRTFFASGATVLVIAVGLSRIVLGVHYPGDVLAGWALAILVVAALALLDVATVGRKRS